MRVIFNIRRGGKGSVSSRSVPSIREKGGEVFGATKDVRVEIDLYIGWVSIAVTGSRIEGGIVGERFEEETEEEVRRSRIVEGGGGGGESGCGPVIEDGSDKGRGGGGATELGSKIGNGSLVEGVEEQRGSGVAHALSLLGIARCHGFAKEEDAEMD